MPLEIISNRKHHGKTVRTIFTAADDSREAVDAAFAAFAEHNRRLSEAAPPKVKTTYRKKKAPKQG